MPKLCYAPRKFAAASLGIIRRANVIIRELASQVDRFTLRQLYYQLVARDVIPNTQRSYKNFGAIVNDARLAGLIDWDAIEDRTRNLHELPAWPNPAAFLFDVAPQCRVMMWAAQDWYVECWCEKEALAGVFEPVCDRWRVPFFACRGYVSQTEMHAAAQRLLERIDAGKQVVILYFGDHDPSGLDMTRDIADRLELFTEGALGPEHVQRVALTMDQVREYGPPPNPAKATDSRFGDYRQMYSDESWELDALNPATLRALLAQEIESRVDAERWAGDLAREGLWRNRLLRVAEEFSVVGGEG